MANTTAIVPRDRKLAKPMRVIISNALTAQAKAVKVDFGVTTRTWKDRPAFTIAKPGDFVREVATDSELYAMLDEGTRAHEIRPKRGSILVFKTPFRSKTVPNQIMSRKGSEGKAPAVARVVHHPGTAARNWAATIAKKWQKQLPAIMQRAIDSAVE